MKSNKAFFNGEARAWEKMAKDSLKEAERYEKLGNAKFAAECRREATFALDRAAEMRRQAKRS